jgi:hypothetical protein
MFHRRSSDRYLRLLLTLTLLLGILGPITPAGAQPASAPA